MQALRVPLRARGCPAKMYLYKYLRARPYTQYSQPNCVLSAPTASRVTYGRLPLEGSWLSMLASERTAGMAWLSSTGRQRPKEQSF